MELKSLQEACSKSLRGLISVHCVTQIFQFSQLGSYEDLIDACVKFILENLEEVKSHGFYDLSAKNQWDYYDYEPRGSLTS